MPPDRWLELTVRLPEPPPVLLAELLSDLLMDVGGRAVAVVEGAMVTYVPPPSDLEGFVEAVRTRIRERAGPHAPELHWRWQRQEDWEVYWRWGLGPRRVTPRVVVVPTWETVEAEPGDIVVTLDPGMAFGTAEHPTTRGCLRLMDSRIVPGSRVADLGSGSGILSIVAARLGAGEVIALEMDDLACEVARENVAANGVEDLVRVVHAEILADAPLPGGPFDGVMANLQSQLHLTLLASYRRGTALDGWLVLGGILAEERGEVLSAASGAGFVLQDEDEEGDWWSGAFRLAPLPRPG